MSEVLSIAADIVTLVIGLAIVVVVIGLNGADGLDNTPKSPPDDAA